MAILLDRTILRLSGPDAHGFLDNLVTNDLTRLERQPCIYAGLLSPQGKVQADMFVWAEGQGLLVEADPARGPDLLRRLSMFKLRAAVDIADVSAEMAALASLGAADGFAPDPRRAELGFRRIVARGDVGNASADASALEARRIAVGAPDLARDAEAEEVFALEALFEEMNGVDFKKGCFVGQENVSRMKRRATTRKKFCPIAFEGEAIASGTPVIAGGAEVGTVRTGVAGRALALLRLDRVHEALAKGGDELNAGVRDVRLDPPDWLLMPSEKAA